MASPEGLAAVGGRVTGTHGARRRSVRDQYTAGYRKAVGFGIEPGAAAQRAAGDAIEALGYRTAAWILKNARGDDRPGNPCESMGAALGRVGWV